MSDDDTEARTTNGSGVLPAWFGSADQPPASLFTMRVNQVLAALSPRYRGQDGPHMLLSGGAEAIADELARTLGVEGAAPILVEVLASRSLGLHPRGFLRFCGMPPDTARHLLHAIEDPTILPSQQQQQQQLQPAAEPTG